MTKCSNGQHRRIMTAVASLVVVVLPAFADEVDSLAISKDFLSIPRDLVLVADVPQPSVESGKLKIADRLGSLMTDELATALARSLPKARIGRLASEQSDEDALVLECRFSRLVPGSKAKRFWVGFGAGKSVLEVSGVVRENRTGRTVAQFTHARLSWCCGFGSNDTEIRQNLALAAVDIADMVAGHFHTGQGYQWLETAPAQQSTSPAPQSQATGTLRIDATAPNAEIEVDGKFVGTAPLEIPLLAGTHTVAVRKNGFRTWSREITVIEDGKQSLVAELQVEERQ